MTLRITILFYNAECHYAERCILFTINLNVIMLSVNMLNLVHCTFFQAELESGTVRYSTLVLHHLQAID
jgi:hypothetical protein